VGQLIKLEDLALPYALHPSEHLKYIDKQITSASSKFLDVCRRFKQDQDTSALIDQTVRLGFNNVIDAFHDIGQDDTPQRFYIDEHKSNGGIRITDEFDQLKSGAQSQDLRAEVESRWRLVETAWDLGVPRNPVSVDYDPATESLFAPARTMRRKSVTGSRGALNGYQKGACFYCFRDISTESGEFYSDFDHFFPHRLKQAGFGTLIDGVWNLVLACKGCNRGTAGKFDPLPSRPLLLRLYRRNEFLIGSHHPLGGTHASDR
jgi:hypothetical protein